MNVPHDVEPAKRVRSKAMIKKAIIAEGVRIPLGMRIGFNPQEDRERFRVTSRGITVVTREDLAD